MESPTVQPGGSVGAEWARQLAGGVDAGKQMVGLPFASYPVSVRVLLGWAGNFRQVFDHVMEQLGLLCFCCAVINLFSFSAVDNQTGSFQLLEVM